MPAALEGVDWDAAKAAAAMGARLEDIAKDMGVPFRTLQKRAQRGKWLVAYTLLNKAQRARKAAQGAGNPRGNPRTAGNPPDVLPQTLAKLPGIGVSEVSQTDDLDAKSREKGGALVLQTLERNDERISVLASGMALKAVESANKRKKALPINTVQDLDKAVMISKRAAGKDREESKVTVALFGGQQSAQGPMIDAAKRFRVRIADAEVITGQDA